MYRVVILPPPSLVHGLEDFRRRLDPAFHRLDAHVPLLPPFEGDERTVFRAFDEASRGERFDARLGAAERDGDRLTVPLVEGVDEVEQRRATVGAALGVEPSSGPPKLLLGRSSNAAELELAARGIEASLPERRFTVDAVTLLVEDARGLWVVARSRPLR